MYNLVSADKCKVIDIKNGTIYRTLDRPTYFGEKKNNDKVRRTRQLLAGGRTATHGV